MDGWMAFYNTWLQNDIAVLVSHQHGVNGCMDEQTFKKFFFFWTKVHLLFIYYRYKWIFSTWCGGISFELYFEYVLILVNFKGRKGKCIELLTWFEIFCSNMLTCFPVGIIQFLMFLTKTLVKWIFHLPKKQKQKNPHTLVCIRKYFTVVFMVFTLLFVWKEKKEIFLVNHTPRLMNPISIDF